MLALAYQDLPDIDAVTPLGMDDHACLAEIREVLARHGRLDRFGITLLHSHFPIGDNEVLVEHCDDQARSLTMTVQSKTVLESPNLKPTSWRLTDGEAMVSCITSCVSSNGKHGRKHVTFK